MPKRTDCLLLDLGLYPGAEILQRYLDLRNAGMTCRTVAVNPATAGDDEWDELLDAVLGSDRCITL